MENNKVSHEFLSKQCNECYDNCKEESSNQLCSSIRGDVQPFQKGDINCAPLSEVGDSCKSNPSLVTIEYMKKIGKIIINCD